MINIYDVDWINMLSVYSWTGSPSNSQDTQGQWMYSVGKCRNSGSQRRTKWPSGSTWRHRWKSLSHLFWDGIGHGGNNNLDCLKDPTLGFGFGANSFLFFFRNVPSCQHKWDAWRSSRNQCPSDRLGGQNVKPCLTSLLETIRNDDNDIFLTNGGITICQTF